MTLAAPRRGALVQLPPTAAPRVWVFPLNPECVHRHWVTPALDPAVRRPRQRLSFELVLDARLDDDCSAQAELDVPAQLAVLDLLAGAPPAWPLFFVWGPLRCWPVRLLAVHVREEAFDPLLRVQRAVASVQLQVATPTGGSAALRALVRQRMTIDALLAERGLALAAAAYETAFGASD